MSSNDVSCYFHVTEKASKQCGYCEIPICDHHGSYCEVCIKRTKFVSWAKGVSSFVLLGLFLTGYLLFTNRLDFILGFFILALLMVIPITFSKIEQHYTMKDFDEIQRVLPSLYYFRLTREQSFLDDFKKYWKKLDASQQDSLKELVYSELLVIMFSSNIPKPMNRLAFLQDVLDKDGKTALLELLDHVESVPPKKLFEKLDAVFLELVIEVLVENDNETKITWLIEQLGEHVKNFNGTPLEKLQLQDEIFYLQDVFSKLPKNEKISNALARIKKFMDDYVEIKVPTNALQVIDERYILLKTRQKNQAHEK